MSARKRSTSRTKCSSSTTGPISSQRRRACSTTTRRSPSAATTTIRTTTAALRRTSTTRRRRQASTQAPRRSCCQVCRRSTCSRRNKRVWRSARASLRDCRWRTTARRRSSVTVARNSLRVAMPTTRSGIASVSGPPTRAIVLRTGRSRWVRTSSTRRERSAKRSRCTAKASTRSTSISR